MKYRIGLHLFFFLFVLFWLSSCENDDFSLDEYENSNSHLMSEARHYWKVNLLDCILVILLLNGVRLKFLFVLKP